MAIPLSIPHITSEMQPRKDVPTRERDKHEVPDDPAPVERDAPTDVEPGSDTIRGGQMDDNIDDLGRKPDGTELDQPGAEEVSYDST